MLRELVCMRCHPYWGCGCCDGCDSTSNNGGGELRMYEQHLGNLIDKINYVEEKHSVDIRRLENEIADIKEIKLPAIDRRIIEIEEYFDQPMIIDGNYM